MVYKILTLIRYDIKKPLWTPLMVEKRLLNSDMVVYEEFSTSDIEELKIKIKELLEVFCASEIKVINEVDYTLLVNISGNI